MSLWGKLQKIGFLQNMSMVGASKLLFRDTGIFIYSQSDGKLTISSDDGTTSAITLTGGVTVTNTITPTLIAYGGTNITATGLEINAACDASGMVTITGTGNVTAAVNAGRINLLGEVGGNALVTLTLPEATGSGNIYRFIVSVLNTSSYVIKTADATNAGFVGSVNLLDHDASAQTAFFGAVNGASDILTLNGTTTGGQVGDWVEIVDILADRWAIRGQLQCPAGSNVATPFSTT